MDGFLPPVDVGGWLDYNRKRAQQFAQERIDAAGAFAGQGGDWLQRAARRIDDLLPDYSVQLQPPPAPPPPPPEPQAPLSPPPSLNASGSPGLPGLPGSPGMAGISPGDTSQSLIPPGSTDAEVPDWARRAGERIRAFGGQIGPALTGAGVAVKGQGSTMIDTAERDAALTGNLPGAAGLRRVSGGALQGIGNVLQQEGAQATTIGEALGQNDEGRAGRAALEATAGGAPGAFYGAAAHGGLTALGAPEPLANVVGAGAEVLAPNGLIDHVAGLVLKGGLSALGPLAGKSFQAVRPLVARAIDEIGATEVAQMLGRAPGAVVRRVNDLAIRYATEMDPALREGLVNARTYDPTGINPVQGRLASRGAPGRAPGPALLGPVTPEEAAKLKSGAYGAEGPVLTAEPFPPGPGPKGEYTIPHPHGYDMVAAPPPPNTYLTKDGFVFWDRVTRGQSPYAHDYEAAMRGLEQPKYPWDPLSSPPPKPGEPGYGRLPSLAEQPLAEPDWDTKLAGFTPRRGTNPDTLRHLLNRYAMYERFPQEAVDDLVPSHPDLASPGAQQAALDDLNQAINAAGVRRTKNEDRAIASERNVRRDRAQAGAESEEPGAGGDGVYTYTSTKGVGPDGEKDFHFGSSYEVASAIKFDQDPNVVSWQKGAGPRGRVRLVIDPKYGYDPTNEALKLNSDPGPGSEVIYSPDFLVTFRDGSQQVVETKNVGIYNLPAWRIEAKTAAGQRHFEDLWGVGFKMMAEDQLGRPFLRELATADLSKLPADHPLRRVDPGDVVNLQKKLLSASKASRGGANEPRLMEAAQHLMDLNASSKYPISANLDDTRNVEQYMSAARAQAAWHNTSGQEGSTFAVDGQNIPLAPGLGGYMVGVSPPSLITTYAGHELDPYRLAQFRHENQLAFDLIPEARVGTFKEFDAAGNPFTSVDVAVRAPDAQSAAEAANLFRQRMVYNIDATTADRVNPRNWVGTTAFDEDGMYARLRRILDEGDARVTGGGPAGGAFPDYIGLPEYANPRRPGRLRRGAGRAGAGPDLGPEGPGAGVRPVGEDAGAAPEGAGVLDASGRAEPAPDGVLQAPEAPGLPGDQGGSPALGGEGSAGLTAQPGDAVRAALAGVRPYGYARTAGERAFDLSGGVAGAAYGAATAPEDATWQERAKRAAGFGVAGTLVGPTARGALGRYGQRLLADEAGSLGAAAGRGERGGRGLSLGRFTPGDLPELLGSIPLAAPTSLAANLTSGMARSLERVAGVAFEGRPIDALFDLGKMAVTMPGAARRALGEVRTGPTARNPGMTGASTVGDLLSRGGILPGLATSGVRVNAATDAFWRMVNEAGAAAQPSTGRLSAAEAAARKASAGEFATWGGPNSALAKGLTDLKAKVRDPNAPLLDRAIGAGVTTFAPYVMMPERLLRATIGNLVPIEAGAGMVKALRRGDKAAAREFQGRMLAGMAATTALTYAYFQGAITGDRPQDAAEARRREARGEQWNTIQTPTGRISSRYLGSLGMQANAIATTLDAARRAQEKGGDPGAVIEHGIDGAWRWAMDASYLSDLVDFADTAGGPQGVVEATRRQAAGVPGRFVPFGIAGIANAADPYERQTEDFPSQVAARTGLRALTPVRIDPTTGEPQRRLGSGASRYFGERGDVTTPEGEELARLELSPRVLGRTEDYQGAKQTSEQRRLAQQASGSETARAVREAMATPDYAGLPDAEKKTRLQGALRTAADRANRVLGERVARGPRQQADYEWDAIPKFAGVKGDPEEVRRQNAEIQAAINRGATYREKYGEARWRAELQKAEPDVYKRALTPRIPAEALKRQREAIEARYGVKLG